MKRILIIPAAAALLTGLSATAQDFNATDAAVNTPAASMEASAQPNLDEMTIEELNALQLQRLQSSSAVSADPTFQVVGSSTVTSGDDSDTGAMTAESESDAETAMDTGAVNLTDMAEEATTLDEPGAHETISDETSLEAETEMGHETEMGGPDYMSEEDAMTHTDMDVEVMPSTEADPNAAVTSDTEIEIETDTPEQ